MASCFQVLPSCLSRPHPLESTESLSLPMPPHCSDPLSHFLYSRGFVLLFLLFLNSAHSWTFTDAQAELGPP